MVGLALCFALLGTVVADVCSPASPPIWPALFTIHQHKWSAEGNSTVVTYYDHTRGANLIIDDGGENATNLM